MDQLLLFCYSEGNKTRDTDVVWRPFVIFFNYYVNVFLFKCFKCHLNS